MVCLFSKAVSPTIVHIRILLTVFKYSLYDICSSGKGCFPVNSYYTDSGVTCSEELVGNAAL